MKIKILHAHFLINTGNYSNERIGFSVELEEEESIEETVEQLRELAVKIVGKEADELDNERNDLKRQIQRLEKEMKKRCNDYNALAEFLEKQGIKSMEPLKENLKALAPKIEEQAITTIDMTDF